VCYNVLQGEKIKWRQYMEVNEVNYPDDFINKIICGDNREIMPYIPDNSIDLVVTSPPYNVGIDYGQYKDNLPYDNYLDFTKKWLTEVYRILKQTGRIALNIPYEVNLHERGGRIFLVSDYWQLMKNIGYKWAGIVDLSENQPERVKYTAWGSYLSASAPYIYNPKECVIIAYKNYWKKGKGQNSLDKNSFIECVSGNWKYRAETKGFTQANFSLDIPIKAIKILSFIDDIILDPFLGSGTTAKACKNLNRNYIGIEINPEYCDIARKRVNATPKPLFV
jgi:site-specific DNA-methyltransferase (adenine-specific)